MRTLTLLCLPLLSSAQCVWAKKVIGFSNEYETGSCGMYPFAEPDDYSSCSALGPPSAGHVANPSYYCDDYAGAFTWDDYDLARTDYISLDFQEVVGLGSSTATLLILEQNSFGWVGKVEVSHEKDSTSFPTTVFDTSTGSQDGTSCSSPGHTPGSSNILEIPITISAGAQQVPTCVLLDDGGYQAGSYQGAGAGRGAGARGRARPTHWDPMRCPILYDGAVACCCLTSPPTTTFRHES